MFMGFLTSIVNDLIRRMYIIEQSEICDST